MKTTLFPAAVFAVFLASVAPLHAWAGALPPLSGSDRKVEYKGVQALTHHKARVYGMFINATTYYYYDGTTEELQAFLDLYAGTKGLTVKQIVLAKGKGRAHPIGKKTESIEADWMLRTWPASWQPVKQGGKQVKVGQAMSLTIWLDGRIEFAQLHLPKGIELIRLPAAK